ncbi:hypothetical protein DCC39_12695 [Pueribacillus theae]|uniref:Cytochrome c oxidase assembly protein n=2 Tax=Pueribacillus theae TaxID=2171751 RepID=A0A2U1JX68_9BACI|nr:cytochrome c oxidase assembly protein [Pueribacillus theae]PWA09722.1 hypothetical protein DCC39_12695 [Pueribacillus theae]
MGFPFEYIFIFLFIGLIVIYVWAGLSTSARKHLKTWPLYRYVLWILGVFSAAAAVVGPLAARAHSDFAVHMVGHLLLGMLAPLLFVLAAPMTLLLRTVSVAAARRISKLLRSWPVRIVHHPIVASFLNIGGLWVLYTTNLYEAMGENFLLHVLVHLHVFLAGYVFTASMIYIDPIAHRFSFIFRSIAFIFALAGHQILSKYIYAYPPNGVARTEAEAGGMIMYYGGDAIDLMIIFILCYQWFRETRPRSSIAVNQSG